MKAFAFVLSFVCLSTARNIRWSPDATTELGGEREIKEHQHWPHLSEVLGEDDVKNLMELLEKLFQIYRPIVESFDENFHQEFMKPHKPLPYEYHRPSHIVEPFPHPLDGISSEVVEEGIVRPFLYKPFIRPPPPPAAHILPVEVEGEAEPFPQKVVISPPPAYILPIEVDGETEISFLQLRPLENGSGFPGEIVAEGIAKPFQQKPFMPPPPPPVVHILPVEVDEDMIPPMESVSEEIIAEGIERPFPQQPIMPPPAAHILPVDEEIMRPLEAVSDDIKGPEMTRPFLSKPNKRPQNAAGENDIQKPLSLEAEVMN
ncbi:hypothetical protein Bhyg_16654 [Pseudolycoriella hygida]|uniref:Uncharacterized protein n=1 Tax=Pseudolycoriella hygida TaxID=35572 RepID=A0A9Q0RSQ9_9DIPT|nr:hypothetical protein Bhyg_16654 [Pseudolycoriella hygida]